MPTDLRTCKFCGTRIIFPRTTEGKKMPPVNYGADDLGTVAVQHAVSGAWIGRWLAKDEAPIVPEKRYAQHWCDGLERRRQRRRGQALGHRRERRTPQAAPTLFTMKGTP